MSNVHSHFLEIKWRFFYLTLSTFSTFLIFYNCQIEIVYMVGKPFNEFQQTFVFLELTEAFYSLLRISAILTFLVIIPFFFYQVWSFFIPSLYNFEREKVNTLLGFFFFLFICEIFSTYTFLLPKICKFLISFEVTSSVENGVLNGEPLINVEFTARIESYVKLIVRIFSVLLFLFQIPLCICLFYSKKVLHVDTFSHNRPILWLISLLLSAFLVPPDVLSQLGVATFFCICFELLIFVGLFFDSSVTFNYKKTNDFL